MQKSLMIGISEKDMQAVVNTYDLNAFLLSYAFPIKRKTIRFLGKDLKHR